MEIEGGYVLNEEQIAQWMAFDLAEYTYYVEEGLFDPESGELIDDPPSWMIDGDPATGPFDFSLNPSHGTDGW